MKSAALHVGIVGCGPAGLMAAVALGRRGHRVTLLERAPKLAPVGAGLLLQPSGQLALSALGLLDEVIANAEPISGLHAQTHRGRLLVHLAYKRLSEGMCGYGVHRNDLFQVLYAHAVRAGVEFRLGITVQSARQSPKEIWAMDDAGGEQGPFDVLVAADGGRSLLRNCDRLGAVVREMRMGAAWFSGHCDAVRGELYQVTRGGRQLIGLLPLGGGRCSFFCALPPGGKDALASHGLDALKQEVIALCPQAKSLLAEVSTLDQLTFTRYPIARLKRWSVGRLACIGDAAHSTTPHLGQGVNLALLDALSLAKALDGADDVPGALAAACAFRRRQVMWCWRLSNLLGPVFQNEGWLLPMARDLTLPWLPRLPFIGRLMVGTMAGLRTGMFSRLQME